MLGSRGHGCDWDCHSGRTWPGQASVRKGGAPHVPCQRLHDAEIPRMSQELVPRGPDRFLGWCSVARGSPPPKPPSDVPIVFAICRKVGWWPWWAEISEVHCLPNSKRRTHELLTFGPFGFPVLSQLHRKRVKWLTPRMFLRMPSALLSSAQKDIIGSQLGPMTGGELGGCHEAEDMRGKTCKGLKGILVALHQPFSPCCT